MVSKLETELMNKLLRICTFFVTKAEGDILREEMERASRDIDNAALCYLIAQILTRFYSYVNEWYKKTIIKGSSSINVYTVYSEPKPKIADCDVNTVYSELNMVNVTVYNYRSYTRIPEIAIAYEVFRSYTETSLVTVASNVYRSYTEIPSQSSS